MAHEHKCLSGFIAFFVTHGIVGGNNDMGLEASWCKPDEEG